MKIANKVLCGAMVFSLSAVAYAQTPTAAPSPGVTAESSATTPSPASKKVMRAENKALAKRVEQVLRRTKGLDQSDIVAFAMAGTGEVILAGVITDEGQDRIATDAAAKVPGVRSVTSKLTLREAGH
jgi:hyperosmotically inducible periplasmic protein